MRMVSVHALSLNRRKSSLQNLHLVVSSPVFVVSWWIVLLLHTTAGAFMLLMGFIHLFITRPNVYQNLWFLQIELSTLKVAGFSFLLIALPHFAQIVKDVRTSIACNRLTFDNGHKSTRRSQSSRHRRSSAWRLVRFFHAARLKASSFLLSVGVRGKYFEVGFCARQMVEIASQTYQAHLFSWAVPNPFVNRALTVLIVLNCVFSPLVDFFFKYNRGAHKASLLGVDLILDLAVSVIVPLCIIVPRLLEFDWKNGKYADELRFNEVWFVQALSGVHQVLVTTTLDFISTMIPHLAALESLGTLKVVLLRVKSEQVTVEPFTAAGPTDAKKFQQHTIILARKHRIARAFDGLAAAWALLVLSAYIHADNRSTNKPTAECTLPMKPWLASNTSCAVFSINCYRSKMLGSSEDISRVMSRLDRVSLMRLTISHCPGLSVPHSLSEFPELLGIQIFNCSITDWSNTATITEKHNRKLLEIQFFDTMMNEFPVALVHGQLPRRLSVMIHNSNLTMLPESAPDAWAGHKWPYFSLEHVPLRLLPPSFKRARAFMLTFYDTNLEFLADDVFADQEFAALRLPLNRRLSEIPDNVGSTAKLLRFFADRTNVSRLPLWLDPWLRSPQTQAAFALGETVSFFDSPVCRDDSRLATREICSASTFSTVEDRRYEIVKARRIL